MEYINSKSLFVDSNKAQVRIGSDTNLISGLNSSILGGINNAAIADNTFVLGNRLTATFENVVYVNNLSAQTSILGPDSVNWNSVYSYTNSNSAFDQAARSFVNSNSAEILNSYNATSWVFSNSAREIVVSTVVNNTSANWNSVYSYTNSNSAFDQAARSWVNNNSAREIAVSTVVNNTSANWNSVYSNVNSNSATYATILFTNNKFLPLSGGVINGTLSITGNVSSSEIIYSKELDFGSLERPSLTGIKQALNSFLYVAPALSYLRINGSSSQILEVGQALTTPVITWNSNKIEPQAVFQYMLTLENGSTSTGNFTFSTFNDSNTYNIATIGGTATQQTSSWSVRVTDWAGTQATGTASANWRYRVYFGVTSSATPNSTDILNGVTSETNRPLTTARTGLGSKTVSPSNQYFYVAYPQRFGTTSTIRVNGLNFTDFTQQSIATFTNASNGTDSYYVYRSNNLLTATYTIEII